LELGADKRNSDRFLAEHGIPAKDIHFPPSRLEKNYLLILGQFEPSAVQEFSVNQNDPMLVSARDIALQDSPSKIFDLPEPTILRENYYSGQSPTDSEEGSYR